MKKVSVLLLSLVALFVLVGCNPTTEETTTTADDTTTTSEQVAVYEDRVVNDSYTLLLQSSTMDGVFNPFFYSSSYDGDVIGLVSVGLLTLDPTGAVVAGDNYPTVAQSYSIYYTDDLTNYTSKSTYEEGDYVVYDIVLKNGAKFSDGTVIDADDVLFNYYVYLDPAYNGSSTLYTLPILGLSDYRSQIVNSETQQAIANQILEDNGRVTGYVQTSAYTETQFNDFWAAFETAGVEFTQEIVDYITAYYIYATNSSGAYYVDAYSSLGSDGAGFTPDQIAASATLQVAYAMDMWGYGSISTDGLTFTGASGITYNVADLTTEVYWSEILAANTDENGDVVTFAAGYQGLSDYESAGSDFVARAIDLYLAPLGAEGNVADISGLVKGTTVIDGETYETIKIILTEQNPKAILSLGVTVAPQHYYTAGYTPTGTVVNYGVEWNSAAFMSHLATFNSDPMGAGTYKYVSIDSGDGTVYFERNEYFETMGGYNVYNANIKYVALKIISSGSEYEALDAGDVAYATVSATATVMENVASSESLVAVLVDNLGYGYININPEVYPNLNFRIALTTVFDMTKVYVYYPNGLADLITRSMSQVSWAYPEDADYIYPFDETLASAIYYFKEAGYTYNETTGKFTDVPEIDFTLPSGTDAHPAGQVYLTAQALLATIGITANIVTDTSLIANIKTQAIGVYALAWGSTADPDMYQVFHYASQASSVESNGIQWLYENGDDDTLGTIQVVKLDGEIVEMNQKEALQYLGDLIEEGTKYMLPEERAPIYAKALEILAQLNIEIPTYQRKNLFVYDNAVIDATTVSTTVTPYWGPLAEIWKLSFASGVQGNETVQGLTGYTSAD